MQDLLHLLFELERLQGCSTKSMRNVVVIRMTDCLCVSCLSHPVNLSLVHCLQRSAEGIGRRRPGDVEQGGMEGCASPANTPPRREHSDKLNGSTHHPTYIQSESQYISSSLLKLLRLRQLHLKLRSLTLCLNSLRSSKSSLPNYHKLLN